MAKYLELTPANHDMQIMVMSGLLVISFRWHILASFEHFERQRRNDPL